jgi:hypothetical protein
VFSKSTPDTLVNVHQLNLDLRHTTNAEIQVLLERILPRCTIANKPLTDAQIDQCEAELKKTVRFLCHSPMVATIGIAADVCVMCVARGGNTNT